MVTHFNCNEDQKGQLRWNFFMCGTSCEVLLYKHMVKNGVEKVCLVVLMSLKVQTSAWIGLKKHVYFFS